MRRAYFLDGGGPAMSEAPILKDTTRSSGREALQKNIQAAMALSEAIRSTLGPKGLDKLLIDDDGRTLVTNDGVTVLETAKVEHPVAKMMINASSTQDRIAKDGTTSTVILAGEMLQNAWQLILQGIHPSTIARGYRKSEQHVLECMHELLMKSNDEIRKTVVKIQYFFIKNLRTYTVNVYCFYLYTNFLLHEYHMDTAFLYLFSGVCPKHNFLSSILLF